MLIDGFDEAHNNISASYLKVGDKSMSVICFWTMAKGNLPYLSYIFCKPKPLGKEFKIVHRSITGALIFIKIQRGKYGKKNSKYHLQLGATVSCTKRMM